jgi:hypothetical protein
MFDCSAGWQPWMVGSVARFIEEPATTASRQGEPGVQCRHHGRIPIPAEVRLADVAMGGEEMDGRERTGEVAYDSIAANL